MQIYHTLNVDLTYQNFGSVWLGILRGPTEQIELAFNGLFNMKATSGEMEYQDHLSTLSTFWTSRRRMRRYFFNRYYFDRQLGRKRQGKIVRAAMRYAHSKLRELSGIGHETFKDFAKDYTLKTYSTGNITAERPDADMKDAILAHAFKEKEDSVKKSVDIG
jgi:hypothetical protein